jgi:hypothetical protein
LNLKFYTQTRRDNPEARLQRAVCEHLRLTALPGVLYLKITNEGKRSAALGAEFKRQGLKPGAADLLIVIDGRAYFLELKAAREKPSLDQLLFADEAIKAGADYQWADNIDDALNFLRCWGAIPGQARAA